MKCYKCGNEIGEGFEVCPVCAAPLMPTSPFANKILTVLKDKLFLVICILMSVSCVTSVFSGGGLPLIAILATIFLWITYSKGREGIVNVGSMRSVSGVVYAEYIIINVCAIIFAVVGILLGGLISLIGTSTELMQSYMEGFSISGLPVEIDITEALAIGLGWVVAGLFVFIGAIMLVVNIFGWRKLHGFVKSVYVGVQNCGTTPVVNARVAKIWLWVFGIFAAIGALGSMSSFLLLISNGCAAATYIIGAILVDRYFVEKEVFVPEILVASNEETVETSTEEM